MNQLTNYPIEKKEPLSLTELKDALDQEPSLFDKDFFDKTFAYMEILNHREIELNHLILSLHEQLSELGLSMNRLSPLDIADFLEILRKEIESCPSPVTEKLKKHLQEIQDAWHHLNFLFFFSIAQELNQDSFQSNLIHRISMHITSLQQKGSKQATILKKTLSSLQQQCQVAEAIFSGKGLESYDALPSKTRLDIERRIFERFPDFSLKNIESEEEREILCAAIMASLSERMLGINI